MANLSAPATSAPFLALDAPAQIAPTQPTRPAPAAARSTTGSDQPLRVRVSRPGSGVVVLHAGGSLDTAGERRFSEPLRQRMACTAPTVVLDLSAVTFLNTAGAEVMVDAAHRAEVTGKSLLLISSPAVDRLLGLLDLAERFTYASSTAAVTGRSADEPLGVVGA